MRKSIFRSLMLGITVLLLPLAAYAIDFPHETGSAKGYKCSTCHAVHMTLGTKGFNNVCMGCHNGSDVNVVNKVFSLQDPSNAFGNNTTAKKGLQTSHNWAAPDTNAAAGALPPTNFYLNNKTNFLGVVTCVRCHSIHNSPNSTTTSKPFLRVLNDQDQLCLDCHRSRNTRDITQGTHPVSFTYTSATSKVKLKAAEYNFIPVNANPSNPTSNLGSYMKNGMVLCSTCHKTHKADSSSASYDSYSAGKMIQQPSAAQGLGMILRTDMRGATSSSVNICSNCHVKPNHNKKNQNVQCADCHAGHVDTGDGSQPNVYVVRRFMNISTQYGAVRNKSSFYQSTSSKNFNSADVTKPGVCQSCHVVPTGGSYPPEHTVTGNGKICMGCHIHNASAGAFSASCNQCHGYPPSLNIAAGPSGYAVDGVKNYATSGVFKDESKVPHTVHAGTAPYSFACGECHYNNVHDSGNFQQVFNTANNTLVSNGLTLAATPVYNKTAARCSTYCHSNGSPRAGLLTYTSVSWTNTKGSIIGSAGECGACHAALPQTNVHPKHVNNGAGKGYACEICHIATVKGSSTITSIPNHVNGLKEVAFSSNSAAQGASWNSASGSCSTLYCHSQGTTTSTPYLAPNISPAWTGVGALACQGCHGGDATTTYPIATGKHGAHINPAANASLGLGNGFGCVQCHAKTVSNNTTIVNQANHVNRFKDYSGARAGGSAKYNTTTKQCSNIYCHSNGNPGNIVYQNPAAWNSATTYSCNGCHGASNPTTGAPDYANGGPLTTTANSHPKHVAGAGINDTKGCANCHVKTADQATASKFKDYTAVSYHLNGTPNVIFKQIGSSTGTWNAAANTCSNTYCHGTAPTPAWGSPSLACNACHSANSFLPGAHGIHYATTTLPSKYVNYSGNQSTTGAYRFTCSSCHGSPAQHAAGPANAQGAGEVFFGFTSATRKGTYSYGATIGNDNGFSYTNGGAGCNTTYCHSNGQPSGAGLTPVAWSTTVSTGTCVQCHDTASTIATPTGLSGKHDKHMNPTNNTLIGLGNGFGCVQCHAKTVSSNTTIVNKANHVNKFIDYSGVRAGSSAKYSTTTKQCSNIYCHSNGNPGNIVYQNPAAWNSATTYSCNGCHGASNPATGAPDYINGGAGTATANSHPAHITKLGYTDTTGCAVCHVKTADSATPSKFKDYTAASYHLSGGPNVVFKQIGGKTGSTTYAGYNVTCSNTYCHGTGPSAAWGSPSLACNSCHSANNNLPGAHQIHVQTTAVASSYINMSGNVSSAGQYRFSCAACHSSAKGAKHANGPANVNGPAEVFFGFTSAAMKGGTYNYGGASAGLDPTGGFSYTGGGNNPAICNNTYCHSNGQGSNGLTTVAWSTTASTGTCVQCHDTKSTTAAATSLSGKHDKHMNPANNTIIGLNNGFNCIDCHAKTVNGNTSIVNRANHVNKFIDFSSVRGGGSVKYSNATKVCSNIYCHSNGNPGALVYKNMTGSKSWGGAYAFGTTNCSGCHGSDAGGQFTSAIGAPNYVSGGAGTTTANSHKKHTVDAGMLDTTGCSNCHVKTVDAAIGFKFKDYTAASYHLSGGPNVIFKSIGGSTGSFSGSTCSSTYCHGSGASPAWGATVGVPLTCNTCHSAAAAGSGAGYNNWSSASAHRLHWEDKATLPSSYTMAPGNTTGTATTYRFACSSCHDPNRSQHAGGPANTNRAAQVYFGYTTAGKNPAYTDTGALFSNDNGFKWTAGATGCTNTYCHSDGNGGAGRLAVNWSTTTKTADCTACHGNDIASAQAITSGKHSDHINPAYAGSTIIKLGAGNGFGCVACHAKTVSGNRTLVNKANHLNKFKDYSGAKAGGSYSYSTATKVCSNIYCHSNGNPGALVFVSMTGSKTWGGAATLGCNGCHGRSNTNTGAPDYANGGAGSTTANSHAKHVSVLGITSTTGCSACHVKTVDQTTASKFKDYTAAGYHLNGAPNVIMSPAYGGTFSANVCTNVSCHSNGKGTYQNPTWGQIDNCGFCHPIASLGGAHKYHIDVTQTPAYYTYTANRSAGSTYNYGCSNCHPLVNSSHTTGSVQLALANTDAGGAVSYIRSRNLATPTIVRNPGVSVTCFGVYCHSNGGGAGQVQRLIYTQSPDWYGAYTGDKCAMCHANSPNSSSSLTFKNITGSAAHYNKNWLSFANISAGHGVSIHYDNIYKGSSQNGVLVPGATAPSAHGDTYSTTLNCNACHYATVTTGANDHNVMCAKCHNGTTAPTHNPAGDDMLLIANTANHVNGKLQVVFRNMTGFRTKAQVRNGSVTVAPYNTAWTRVNGYKASNSYDKGATGLTPAYNSGTWTCSNVACHNGQSVTWNDTFGKPTQTSCASCHTAL